MTNTYLNKLYYLLAADIELLNQANKDLKRVNKELAEYNLYNRKKNAKELLLNKLERKGIKNGPRYTDLVNKVALYSDKLTKIRTDAIQVHLDERRLLRNNIETYKIRIDENIKSLTSYIDSLTNLTNFAKI